jgi:hypothetical protein
MNQTRDSTLADPQEIDGGLQRQLAQCRAERDEALARETAMADVLRVINSSPGDLAPVFDTILEKAHTLCGVEHGVLVVHDGEHFRAVATHNLPREFAELYRQPFGPSAGSPLQPLINGERLATQVTHRLSIGTIKPLSRYADCRTPGKLTTGSTPPPDARCSAGIALLWSWRPCWWRRLWPDLAKLGQVSAQHPDARRSIG